MRRARHRRGERDVDLDALAARLQTDGLASFAGDFAALLDCVAREREALRPAA